MFRTLQTLQSFLDSRFKILGETFWIQLLSRLDSWRNFLNPDSRFKIQDRRNFLNPDPPGFKIQDSRRNFLNPDPPSRLTSPGFKIQDSEGNFLNPKPPGFKIQDSRRNFLNQNYPFRLPSSRPKAWDSKSFPQNLESWIQKTLQSLQSFLDSRFKILGETFWIQIPLLDLHLLDSRFKIQDSEGNFLNPKPPGFKIQDSRRNFLNQNHPFRLPSSRPKAWDSKSFPQNLESWILNPENFAKFAKFSVSKLWELWYFYLYIYIKMCTCLHGHWGIKWIKAYKFCIQALRIVVFLFIYIY